MGRRATVLSIWGGENDPTGLPEPLGLFLDPKNGQKEILCPPAGGQPFRAVYTGCVFRQRRDSILRLGGDGLLWEGSEDRLQ